MKIIKGNVEIKYYKEFNLERWSKFSFDEQLGNAGADISRAIAWRKKDEKISKSYFEKGLELLDLTIKDYKNITKLKELSDVRQELVNYFCGHNFSNETDKKWENYFYKFAYASAIAKGY